MIKNREIEQARALYYKFFGTIFSFIDNQKQVEDINKMLSLFQDNPMSENSKEALLYMSEFLQSGDFKKLKEESDEVFISPNSMFVPMTASYYDEGRDDGQKRVKIAEFVLRSKFRKNELKCKDSEDNLVFIFLFMHALIQAGVDGDEKSLELSKELFTEVINDFWDDFIDILYIHESTRFYKNSAVLMGEFLEFERFYLQVAPSQKEASKEKVSTAIKRDRKPLTQKIRRNLDEITL